MYKILNTQGLGVSGRQNELIELALTHKFDGVEVDMVDLLGRHDTLGNEFACQFLNSADIDMGTFALPVALGASEEAYKKACGKLDTVISLAKELGAKRCYVKIESHNPTDSFDQNFETHRQRLAELAEKFADAGIKIGLYLQATNASAAGKQNVFIQTAEQLATLVKTVGHPNIGVCLDLFEWTVGGGTVDQIKGLLAASSITEVRLADLKEGVDPASAKKSDRTALPANVPGSISFQVAQLLKTAGYDETISVATDLGTYSSAGRNTVVSRLSKQLDQLIEGIDPAQAAIDAEQAAAAEAAESGEEADSADADAEVAASS